MKKTTLFLMIVAMLSIEQKFAAAGSLDEPDQMAPFYTDAQMKTIKPDADIKAAWEAMSGSDQAKMRSIAEQMERGVRQPDPNFIKKIKALSGDDQSTPTSQPVVGDSKKP